MIEQLPYVNGLPDEGQSRVNWIKNGEPLDGASTKNGVDGPLNRGPVQVQMNVEVLDKNIHFLADSQVAADGKIKQLEDALNIVGDVDVVRQVGINTSDIGVLKTDSGVLKTASDDHELRIGFLEEDMGEFNPTLDSVYRPVRGDLLWIKTEMGQYPGQDINGRLVDGNLATGIKRRIIDTAFEVNSNTTRIKDLEQKFIDSDVGALTVEVGKIRREIGDSTQAKADSIYTRLDRLSTSVGSLAANMDDVLDSIGFNDGIQNLNEIVKVNTSSITSINAKLDTPGTGVIARVSSIETQIGNSTQQASINGRIAINTKSISDLGLVVGADTSSGLRGQVGWINQVVGIVPQGQTAPPTSLIGQMTTMTNLQTQMGNTIQDLQVDIGNNNEGLKGQVIRLNTIIMGTNPTSGTTVDERGLQLAVKTHDTDIKALQTQVTALIPEAPKDGKAYVRKDGAWVDLTTLLP